MMGIITQEQLEVFRHSKVQSKSQFGILSSKLAVEMSQMLN